MKPLEGIAILDFSQFLSAPSATLHLVDFGARIIKVERPDGGDICHALYVSDLIAEDNSSLFHSINRNKYGVSIDLKSPTSRDILWSLIGKADIMIVSFHSGVMEKLELDYASVKQHCPSVVYGEITGYGKKGPWSPMPGRSLLVQSLSGLAWSSGNQNQPSTPMELSMADLFAGQHLAQGILVTLIKRVSCGKSSYVHVSTLESVMDMQSRAFTTYLNDGGRSPKRSVVDSANDYINTPYGIYQTLGDYLATAIVPVPVLGEPVNCDSLIECTDSET